MAARVARVLISWLALSVVPTSADNPLSMVTSRIPKLKLQVDRVENCRDIPPSVIQLDDLTLSQTGFNQFSANGKVKISRTVDKPISMSIEMHKCSSKDDANSCEFFLSMRKSRICNMLQDPKSGWQEFTKNSDLPKTCPFAAKVYHVKNSTMEFKNLASFPMFQSSWKIRSKYYQQKELVGCTDIGLTTTFVTKT